MVDSVEFAKYVLFRVREFNQKNASNPISIGETKLQKIVYICDGYLLAVGINFIYENVRAWNYGPVYPKLHKWADKYENLLKEVDNCSAETIEKIKEINAEPLVDRVIETYGHSTAQSLSLWAHSPGSPWEKALERGWGVMNSPLNKNDMRDYFKELLNASSR